MERILEPEIMDDAEQAAAYAQADFSASNRAFVEGLESAFPDHLQAVLDIGCGPADIAALLATRRPDCRITGVDGSPTMLDQAHAKIRQAGVEDRVQLVCQRLPGLSVETGEWTAIVSKDLLHHLPDPQVLWTEIARLGAPNTAVYVMDLFRPDTPQAARDIVEAVSGGEADILKEDFYNSLLAAFTPEEVADQLAQAGMALTVETVSDRHMVIRGWLDR